VTVILLLVAAAVGVAGLLHAWGMRLDLDVEAPEGRVSLFPPLSPLRSWTRGGENDLPRFADAPAPQPVAVEPERMNDRVPVMPRDADDDEAMTMRFVRPSDVVVQLLPGRLEVLEGRTPHREIRFLCATGESPHVILGRRLGVTPHYIGLGSPTVSRRHARLDFADNRWIVKNLSRTNPLIINDDELSDTEPARPLADGDRLELGDVVLRFHAR
jgi:hypothetical protein